MSNPRQRSLCDDQRDTAFGHAAAQALDLDVDDSQQVVLRECAEADDVVDAVDEFGLEEAQRVAREVRCHDQHDVGEVDGAALAIRQSTVVEHLQQHVEHIGVRLFDLVQEDDAIGAATHCFGQLAALVVSDVTGGRPDETSDGELLHVLAHVDTDHRLLVVEQVLGNRARQLGLADAGRPEEHERTNRPVGVGEPGA